MSLTKQQRVMMTVLAFGVAAVAFDRLVLGTGATLPNAANAHAAEPAAAQGDRKDAPVRMRTVAAQLGGVEGLEEVEDAFFDRTVPIVIEVPSGEAQAGDASRDGALSTPQAGSRPERTHVLTAILSTPSGPIAVVDGRALQADRPSGGMTLRSVEGGSAAMVEIAGTLVRLEIAR